jgi:hypothetical protein
MQTLVFDRPEATVREIMDAIRRESRSPASDLLKEVPD